MPFRAMPGVSQYICQSFIIMEQNIGLKIILQQPNEGVWFGIQQGAGNDYDVILKEESTGKDMAFDFTIKAKTGKDGELDFSGPTVQGPRGGRFIYIDIGTCAGQRNSIWTRRLKVPLTGLTFEMIDKLVSKNGILQTLIAGKGKDGGPTCGTVKPFDGWKLL